MILTIRARKKLRRNNLTPENILTVIESGQIVDESNNQTVGNGRGGKRLRTHREKHSTTVLKQVEGIHVRFIPGDNLVIDIYVNSNGVS
jgi:hypothetical protein